MFSGKFALVARENNLVYNMKITEKGKCFRFGLFKTKNILRDEFWGKI